MKWYQVLTFILFLCSIAFIYQALKMTHLGYMLCAICLSSMLSVMVVSDFMKSRAEKRKAHEN